VYDSVEEFVIKGGDREDVCYWKDAIKEGQWVEADDGGVVQILKFGNIKHPHDRKNWKAHKGWVRTVVGTFLINDSTYMDTDFTQHPNRYTFSKTLKYSNDNFKKRKNITQKEKLFTTQVIVGKDAVAAAQSVYNIEDFNKAKTKAIALLAQERIMEEIEKSVVDIAKQLGIDHSYVLGKLKFLADEGEDDNIILQSTKELGKIIGTSQKQTKREVGVLGVFKGFSPDQLEGAVVGRQQITGEVINDEENTREG